MTKDVNPQRCPTFSAARVSSAAGSPRGLGKVFLQIVEPSHLGLESAIFDAKVIKDNFDLGIINLGQLKGLLKDFDSPFCLVSPSFFLPP